MRSLGIQTDLMSIRWDGLIQPQPDGVVVVRTPTNPSFYYGNFLLYPEPPRTSDVEAWPARFADAFGNDPAVRHVCLRWDRTDGAAGAADAFVAHGYTIDRQVVLTTQAPTAPPHANRDVRIAPVETDAEWAAVADLQAATMVAEWGASADGFARTQVQRHRRNVAAQRGVWLAAWDGPDLAADLGVFVEDGVGRYANVETSAAYRRRGICATLVHHAARLALGELGARTLVMCAIAEEPAARVYMSVGFAQTELVVSLLKRP
jgi:hypothetical protein